MKKIFVILLTLSVILSSAFAVSADTVSSYSAYKNAAAYSDPEANIEISGTDYSEAPGAQIAVDESSFGKPVLCWTNEAGSVKYIFTSPTDAKYYFRLFYGTIDGSSSDIRLGIKIDGVFPFNEANEVSFKRSFENAGQVRSDQSGNQFAPEQQEKFGLFNGYAMDSLGRESDPFEFLISAGVHTLELVAIDEPFAIEKIVFEAPYSLISYEDYISGFPAKQSLKTKKLSFRAKMPTINPHRIWCRCPICLRSL